MKRGYLAAIALLAFALSFGELDAQVSLSPLFTDNMVLQQKTDAPIWGTASPGAEITVTTSWNRKKYTAVAGEDGRWMTAVKTPKAGGPYRLTISDGSKERVINDVLIGEVWICSGQSNMEMPVKGWGRVNDFEKELKDASKYPQIRFLSVVRETSSRPEDSFSAVGDGWLVCSPESLEEFSATGYFFGREIHLEEGVPVGLINTSWGGTVIEAWTSRSALTGVAQLEKEADEVASWPQSREERYNKTQAAKAEWEKAMMELDRASIRKDTTFMLSSSERSSWKSVKMPGAIEAVFPAFDGHVLIRRDVDIPASWEGQDLLMNIQAVDDRDMTYFAGCHIGSTDGWNDLRRYTIPGKYVKGGTVMVAMRIIDTGNFGGISGTDDTFYLEGPGGERVSLAGDWEICADADFRSLPAYPVNMHSDPNWSTLLYNSMIHPLVPFAIKGAIWYQGCSNAERAYQYRELMPLMINDWRNAWGYEFPFYITQLANFRERKAAPGEADMAELREAQDMAARTVSNMGMAVTIDIGDAADIHPKNKQEVGRRLALQALSGAYGRSVVCSGPEFEGYTIEGNSIVLRFSSVADGLEVHGDRLEGFAVAGADRKFYWADAVIEGDCVRVSCKQVPMPLAVRYAWADNPACNLYNSAGLPAGPFRTDEWPGITIGVTSMHASVTGR